MGRRKPPLKIFPGVPTSKGNVEHTRYWGGCLGCRRPPALWADPSPGWGMQWGRTAEALVGGREGGHGQHGGGLSPALKVLPL